MVTVATRACAKCGEQILAGDRFCASCGSSVDLACAACGVMLVAADRYCPECGTEREPTGNVGGAWDTVVRVLRSALSQEYRFIRELGRGGQAAVFQAEELALNRTVAIKVLAPGSVHGDRQLDQFRVETQTIAGLKHANIITIYSVKQVEDLHLFVMQYIEGRPLSTVVADRGPLPLPIVRAIAYQIGSALHYAHRKGVYHRDVKPANVLFDEDGNAILTDFGIAKNEAISPAVTAVPMGTLAYSSPEQCQQHPVGPASDQYSFGVMLYELLTGQVPFSGSSFAVMQGHTDREPPPLRALRADCPVEMEWAILRMLAKRPEDRWPSVQDALSGLEARPLTRDDPIREELRRLAGWPGARDADESPRLTIRAPQRVEVGETHDCELFATSAFEPVPQRIGARWQVAPGGVARIDAESGRLVGEAPGQAVLVAESAHGVVEAEILVIPATPRTVTIELAQGTLSVGDTVYARAEVCDRRGARLDVPVQWRVSDPGVLALGRDGEVRALAPGDARLIAEAGEASMERRVFVRLADAAGIRIVGGARLVRVGDVVRFGAETYDRAGNLLRDRPVHWGSSDAAVLAVDHFGVGRGGAVGSAVVRAACGDAEASLAVQVALAEPGLAMGGAGTEVNPQAAQGASPWTDAAVPAEDWGLPPLSDPVPPTHAPRVDFDWRRMAAVVGAVMVVGVLGLTAWQTFAGVGLDEDPVTYLSESAKEEIRAGGYSVRGVRAFEPFDRLEVPQVTVVGGRATLAAGAFSFRPEAWKARGGDFVLRVAVAMGGSSAQEGGVVLGASDGSRYWLQFAGPSPMRWTLAWRRVQGGDSTLVALRDAPPLSGENQRVEIVSLGGHVTMYIDGQRLGEVVPPIPLDGSTGIFVSARRGMSFDELLVLELVRK